MRKGLSYFHFTVEGIIAYSYSSLEINHIEGVLNVVTLAGVIDKHQNLNGLHLSLA